MVLNSKTGSLLMVKSFKRLKRSLKYLTLCYMDIIRDDYSLSSTTCSNISGGGSVLEAYSKVNLKLDYTN